MKSNIVTRTIEKITGYVSKLITGRIMPSYELNSAKRVDVTLTRELYRNTNDSYKLGAAFAKPIINVALAFMGLPKFKSEDKDADDILTRFTRRNKARLLSAHRTALRDGDSFVWLGWKDDPEGGRVQLVEVPPEEVKEIVLDPLTREPVEYILEARYDWMDSAGVKRQAQVIQRITAKQTTREYKGDIPAGTKAFDTWTNPTGIIPLVHFANETESFEVRGRSDLEAVEPFLKAYHDTALQACRSSRMNSDPKIWIPTSNVRQWLIDNAGAEKAEKIIRGEATLDLEGQSVLFSKSNEKPEMIQASSATGDSLPLLKLLFLCIVDVSETPEFVFGTKLSGNDASVKEQMPVLIRRVERKRDQFESAWQHVAELVLRLHEQADLATFGTYETDIEWEKVDPRTDQEIADALHKTALALEVALRGNFISQESATDYFSRLVPTMKAFRPEDGEEEGERERIFRSVVALSRLGDDDALAGEKQAVDKLMRDAMTETALEGAA